MSIKVRVEDGLPITIAQARNILQEETEKFGVFIDLDRALEYTLHFTLVTREIERKIDTIVGQNIKPTQVVAMREWFKDAFDVPDRLLLNKRRTPSFDGNVRKALMDADISEEAKQFLELYKSWSHNNYRMGYTEKYTKLPVSYGVSNLGHRMTIARPGWNVLSTSRISAEDPPIQNVARDLGDMICCPEGWELHRFDSSQIEPNVTYSKYIQDRIMSEFIRAYGDAYYGQLHYCMLPEDVYYHRDDYTVAGINTPGKKVIELMPITADMIEGRKALKVLALAATYGGANKNADPVLASRYTERIVNHPQRKEWETRVTTDVKRGVGTFYAAFGSPITPEETTMYKPGTKAWEPHVIRCGINNPIQTTASELMIYSINKAIGILGKSNKSHISYYKHDEGAFYIHNSEKYLADELEGITAYDVTENGVPWLPIGCDHVIGQKLLSDSGVPSVLYWGK